MSQQREIALHEAKLALNKKAERFKLLFSSPAGAEVLRDLKTEFDAGTLAAATPHETTIRAAQHDVIHYIEQLIRYSKENSDAELA